MNGQSFFSKIESTEGKFPCMEVYEDFIDGIPALVRRFASAKAPNPRLIPCFPTTRSSGALNTIEEVYTSSRTDSSVVYKHWDEDQTNRLIEYYNKGLTLKQISKEFYRSPSAINNKLWKLKRDGVIT